MLMTNVIAPHGGDDDSRCMKQRLEEEQRVDGPDSEEKRAQSSLWMPLFGLRILLDSNLHGSQDVNYYDSEDIQCIIKDNQQQNGNESAVKALWWNRYTQSVRTSPPPKISRCRGGILADQM